MIRTMPSSSDVTGRGRVGGSQRGNAPSPRDTSPCLSAQVKTPKLLKLVSLSLKN